MPKTSLPIVAAALTMFFSTASTQAQTIQCSGLMQMEYATLAYPVETIDMQFVAGAVYTSDEVIVSEYVNPIFEVSPIEYFDTTPQPILHATPITEAASMPIAQAASMPIAEAIPIVAQEAPLLAPIEPVIIQPVVDHYPSSSSYDVGTPFCLSGG